jgi:hypothetical protein
MSCGSCVYICKVLLSIVSAKHDGALVMIGNSTSMVAQVEQLLGSVSPRSSLFSFGRRCLLKRVPHRSVILISAKLILCLRLRLFTS